MNIFSKTLKKLVVGRYKIPLLRMLVATAIKCCHRDLFFYFSRKKEISTISKTESRETDHFEIPAFPKTEENIFFGDIKISLGPDLFERNFDDKELGFFIRRFSWLNAKELSVDIKHDILLQFCSKYVLEADVYSIGLRAINVSEFLNAFPDSFSDSEKRFVRCYLFKSYLHLLYNYEYHFKWTNNHFFSNLYFLIVLEVELGLRRSKVMYSLVRKSLTYVFDENLMFKEKSTFYFFLLIQRLLYVHQYYDLTEYVEYIKKVYSTAYHSLVVSDSIISLGDASPDLTCKSLLEKLAILIQPGSTREIIDYLDLGPFSLINKENKTIIISNSGQGSHAHIDFGHIILRSGDEVILEDPGRYSYDISNELSRFQVSEEGHNFPRPKGKSQEVRREFVKNGDLLIHTKEFADGSKAIRKTNVESLRIEDQFTGESVWTYTFISSLPITNVGIEHAGWLVSLAETLQFEVCESGLSRDYLSNIKIGQYLVQVDHNAGISIQN